MLFDDDYNNGDKVIFSEKSPFLHYNANKVRNTMFLCDDSDEVWHFGKLKLVNSLKSMKTEHAYLSFEISSTFKSSISFDFNDVWYINAMHILQCK